MPKVTSIHSVDLDDGENRKLTKDYFYQLDINKYVWIQPGLIWNGASIPKWAWSIIGSPFTGNYQHAALIHDAAYMAELFTRKECDNLFYKVMRECGVSWIKAQLMYTAVRVGGGGVWNAHTEAEVDIWDSFVSITDTETMLYFTK